MERLQGHRERDRTAIWVRDDAVVLEGALAIHFGHDQWDSVLQAIGRRLVHGDCPAPNRVWHELPRSARPDREEREVDVSGSECLGRRLLDDETAFQFSARRPRGSECSHPLEPSFPKEA